MAAYNEVKLQTHCPTHGGSGEFSVQVHAASSFDGDSEGRFCGRTYRLGQVMRWWPASDARYSSWRHDTRKSGSEDGDECQEACYATCNVCGAEHCVVLSFRACTPVNVVKLVALDEWPSDHLR